MESSNEGTAKLKGKRKYNAGKSGKCSYCMNAIAHQMVKLKSGTNSGSRRWMCGLCILKRQRLGLVKKGAEENYVRSA